MINFSQLVFESKDVKAFQKDVKTIIMADQKAINLLLAFRKDADKMVDFIDYLMSKHDTQIDSIMNKYNINYDEAIDLIVKGI